MAQGRRALQRLLIRILDDSLLIEQCSITQTGCIDYSMLCFQLRSFQDLFNGRIE